MTLNFAVPLSPRSRGGLLPTPGKRFHRSYFQRVLYNRGIRLVSLCEQWATQPCWMSSRDPQRRVSRERTPRSNICRGIHSHAIMLTCLYPICILLDCLHAYLPLLPDKKHQNLKSSFSALSPQLPARGPHHHLHPTIYHPHPAQRSHRPPHPHYWHLPHHFQLPYDLH